MYLCVCACVQVHVYLCVFYMQMYEYVCVSFVCTVLIAKLMQVEVGDKIYFSTVRMSPRP